MENIKDLVIIGSGPAGLSAAVYASRAMIDQVVIEKEMFSGGQIVTTDRIDNYLGLYGENGYDLSVKFRQHADELKVPFVEGQVTSIEDKGEIKEITLVNGDVINTKAIIIATGAKHKVLGVKGEKELTGAGVSYCATCDGAFFRNKTVAVVGGCIRLFSKYVLPVVFIAFCRNGFTIDLLMDKGLISKKKYERLTRATELSDSELSDFIARQIVETSQSTKAVASLFKELYPDTEIVYVKASTVSEFRHEYDFLKCREVNDFHHAKDAYLNIVVGNVYNERCTHNKSIFIEGLKTKAYSLNKMFSFNTPNAWSIDDNKSIKIVRKTMNKNNIRFTRYALTRNGGLFKMNPLKKGSGQVSLKQNSPLSDISKYGGYDKPASSYFSFVKYEGKKGKEMRQLVAIDSYIKARYEANPEKYLSENLGLKNRKKRDG